MSKISRRGFELAMMGSLGANLLAPSKTIAFEPEAESEGSAGSITDVPGVKVGHFTDSRRPTGCTAILFEDGATGGVDFDGSGPEDFQAGMLQPGSALQTIWGILLAGGDSYGLSTAMGAMKYLEELGKGEHWGKPGNVVPLVVASILDDLSVGDSRIRPDAESGYKACQAASTGPVAEGCVGAGAGATVGTGDFYGGLRMKSGIGTASIRVGEFVIGAIVAVNATGDVVEWPGGRILAGSRRADGKGFVSLSENVQRKMAERVTAQNTRDVRPSMTHTTIGVIATNLAFNKGDLTKLAEVANTGAAKVINPYHTTEDGDVLYAVSTRRLKFQGDQVQGDIALAGIMGAEVVAKAIMRAVKTATSVQGIPAYRDYTAKLSPELTLVKS
jgi:L-aminopeptidase/D-esterase-like protein